MPKTLNCPRCGERSEVAVSELIVTTTPRQAAAILVDVLPILLEAADAIVAFHQSIFPKGRPLTIDGKPIDHTLLNRAFGAALTALERLDP